MAYCMLVGTKILYKIDISDIDAISETPYISFTK